MIAQNQIVAVEGLEHAKRMRLESDAKFSTLSKGTNVTIPIPEVDRSKADLRNVIGELLTILCDLFRNVCNCVI